MDEFELKFKDKAPIFPCEDCILLPICINKARNGITSANAPLHTTDGKISLNFYKLVVDCRLFHIFCLYKGLKKTSLYDFKDAFKFYSNIIKENNKEVIKVDENSM